MIGSRQGWREVAYAPCPAGLAELAHGLAPVTGLGGRVVHLVPGVARAADPTGFPDVMRGEETQILGASSAAAGGQHCFVLPGTHSKWAWAEHGRIARFATYMTGEVYACLVQHSILGRLMSGHDADAEAFEQGLARARASAGDPPGRLLHDLFSARTLGLFAAVPPTGLASYLSGLLIGCRDRGGPGGHRSGRGDHPRQQRAGAALRPGDRLERRQGGRGRHGCRGARAVRDRAGGGNAGGERAMDEQLATAMAALPLVAILRGLRPEEALGIGEALLEAGFRILEVPLNSPEPFESIRLLADAVGNRAVVGAGTVTDMEQVARLREAGGRLVVMPHTDPEVIKAAKAAGMACLPGVATPSEAFAALRAGADGAQTVSGRDAGTDSPQSVAGHPAAGIAVLPVGGITPDNMQPWRAAGAAGFGLGSALYRPGATPGEVGEAAARFVAAWRRG